MIKVLTIINAVSTFSVLFKSFCYVLYYSILFHWKSKNHFGVVLVYLGFGLYYEYTGVILYIILLKQAESLTQVC